MKETRKPIRKPGRRCRLASLHLERPVVGWLRLGDQELGNMHAALDWAYGNGHPRLGLSIARNLWSYFGRRGMESSRRHNLRAGVELIDDDTPDVLEAAALALITYAHGAGDPTFGAFAAELVERGLEGTDDPSLRSTLLRGLASYLGVTDPSAAEALETAASALQPVPPMTTLQALNNRIIGSWLTGRVSDEDATMQQLDGIVDAVPTLSRQVVGLHAVIAASAGRWDEVLRIAEAAEKLDGVDEYPIALSLAEALLGLGRHDDAEDALTRSERNPDSFEVTTYTPPLRALINLERGNPARAVAALDPLVEFIKHDTRRMAIAVRVTSILAVAAHDLGKHETAAILFGHSSAEQERLRTGLRRLERPSVQRAADECRVLLGGDHFDDLAAQGATMAFTDLPAVELEPATSP